MTFPLLTVSKLWWWLLPCTKALIHGKDWYLLHIQDTIVKKKFQPEIHPSRSGNAMVSPEKKVWLIAVLLAWLAVFGPSGFGLILFNNRYSLFNCHESFFAKLAIQIDTPCSCNFHLKGLAISKCLIIGCMVTWCSPTLRSLINVQCTLIKFPKKYRPVRSY